jgi:glutathione S-transferase
VWESLAIIEYANELAGGRAWPSDTATRAEARAVASEMHAGFGALRNAWPMNIRARDKRTPMTPALASDIARVDALWSDCRQRFESRGPWLFGDYSAADAMFLPVAFRFQTYGPDHLGPVSRRYLAQALADPLIQPWIEAAHAESESIDAYEAVGQP